MDNNLDFLKIKDETLEEFKSIAQILFDKFAIQTTTNELYRIVEIEFYWHSTTHEDNSTYKRKHANPNSGEWFFHYSGVDIALKNDEIKGYGGILIRSIYDLEKKEITKGPMICAMKLFSGLNAFNPSGTTHLIPKNFDKADINLDIRVGLGKNAKESGKDKCTYRFSINPFVK